MPRKTVVVNSGVHPLVCPACGQNTITGEAGFGQSYSRYVGTYICSECGHREAFQGFFWRDRANESKELRDKIKPHHRSKA